MENHCDICEKRFKRKEDLQRHQASHGPPKYSCNLCEYSSHRRDLMMKHRSSAAHLRRAGLQPSPSTTPQIECRVCGITFTLQNNLDRHMREQHDPDFEREFRCRKCNQQFTRRTKLVEHEEFGCPVNRVEQWGATVSHRAPRQGVKRKISEQEPQPGPSSEPQTGLELQPLSVVNKGPAFVRVEVGFRNRLQTFRLQKPMPVLRTIPEVVSDLLERLVGILRSTIEEHPNVKANLFLECEFTDATGEKTCVRAFKTKNTPLDGTSDLEHFVQQTFNKLIHEKEQCEMVGSGWTYLRVKNLEVRINRYRPLGGGKAYIPIPNSIAGTQSVINVRNRDNRCFAYAVLAKFVNSHPERPESYTPDLFARYNWDGLNFPVVPKDIVKFERVNPCNSINVYALEEMYIKSDGSTRMTVYPLRTCQRELQDHTDLLYLTAKDGRTHYCYIKDLGRLVKPQLSTRTNRMYLCKRCFTHFDDRPNKLGLTGPQRLEEHRRYCGVTAPLRMDLASKSTIEFSHAEYSRKERFSVYADFECALRPTADVPDAETPHGGTASHIHIPYAFCYHVHDIRGEACSTETYFGDDASVEFMRRLKRDAKKIKDLLYNERQLRPRLSHAEWTAYNATTVCYLCDKQFVDGDKDVKVRDHNHTPPYEFRGAAHRSCNLRYREQRLINVYFHNLSNYDGHFIVRELAVDHGDVEVIAHTDERYISFTKRFVFDEGEAAKQKQQNKKKGITIRVRFVDSYRFLSSSLASLAAALPPEQLVETKKAFPNEGRFELVRRKGVFPYNYVTDYKVLGSTTELPPKDAFYNDITLEHISNADYEHVRNVWDTFQCESLEDYAAVYLQCDVLLLTDVFEQFRETSLKEYGLDPTHYLTLPSYAWDVMLKLTDIKLDTLRDFDMYLFFEQGIRGGISQAITRYAKANHDRCRAEDREAEEPTRHLMYFDANNLYGWAMSQPLPTSDFEWLTKEEIKSLDILSLNPIGPEGYVLEVDLHYPKRLHDIHKDLPYCCETRHPPTGHFKKLLTTLDDKEHYICHYRILQQALNNGLELTAIHRVVRFRQSRWLETYILKNTELRKKAKTKFEQDYFKLMNNAVFGKTIENVRKRLNVHLVCNPERFSKLVAKPNFLDRTYYGDDVALVHLAKVRIVLEKPIYVGMCVLELSKWLMYEFLHNMKERYGNRLEVNYMDTDSFILTITTENVYRDMMSHLDDFDTSSYPKNHLCYSPVNAKVIGKFKDECNGLPLLEYLGLRSKLYFLDIYDDCGDEDDKTDGPFPSKRIKIVKKAKGIAKGVVKHVLSPDDYRDCLFSGVIKRTENPRFQSHLHRVYTVQVDKLSLSSTDDKRYILPDGIHTLPWGHKDIPNREVDEGQTVGEDYEDL